MGWLGAYVGVRVYVFVEPVVYSKVLAIQLWFLDDSVDSAVTAHTINYLD
jgi:hypothetical protein